MIKFVNDDKIKNLIALNCFLEGVNSTDGCIEMQKTRP